MHDFNFEISDNQNLPKLDSTYWQEKRKIEPENQPIYDANINATYTDLSGISIFKNK